MKTIDDLSKEELRKLLTVYGKNWLAHDGCWFQSCEFEWDLDTAMARNEASWERFTRIEAKRILQFLGRERGEGLEALEEALNFRLYASINQQEIVDRTENSFTFRMTQCRVQVARNRKGLADYPCKKAGVTEYTGFADAIDPRIKTECIGCPPDAHPAEWFCAWKFTLEE
jgi:Family of unknown function (DUF6125)